ncbi:MAG: CRTAC1 family protein [Candidatus Eisenbacteria bacterium]
MRSELYRAAFLRLWDDLRTAEDRWAVLETAALGEITAGSLGPAEPVEGALTRRAILPGGGALSGAGRASWIADLRGRFSLEQFEFLPSRFTDSDPPRTVFATVLDLAPIPPETRRIQVQVDLAVTWSSETDEFLDHPPSAIEVVGGQLLEWSGPPAFEDVLAYENPNAQIIPPICVYDLDGDGWTDVVYPQTNLLFRNEGEMEFERIDFVSFPLRNYYDAVFGDFDGDGVRDFLAAGIGDTDASGRPSLYLYQSDDSGAFTNPPVRVYENTFAVQLAFAAGDIDRDGDLDLFIGKYLPPFVAGQVPTPFHDANDGVPSDLLLNDGTGHFTQGIEGSGLEKFRNRRTFRVSFVDLDEDGDLDLLQTNDFAGTAIYWNDGGGRFELASEGAPTGPGVDEGSSFGMSHTFGDYDGDGEIDFYVTGMYSHTVRRLIELGLGRPDRPDVDDHRMALAYGNRMYMGNGGGRFVQPPFKDSVANTGWSWGVTSFDVENDGDLDLFVANGHLSGASVRDYDSRYWRHDVYQVGSQPDPVKSAYFLDKMGSLGKSESWAGYEHNRLLLRAGDGFFDAGYVLGLGSDVDSRHVVSEDFDRDGRVDLLVGFKNTGTGTKGFRIARNRWPEAGNWISITLQDGPGVSVFGSKVLVETPSGKHTQLVVAGDSFFAQHSNRRTFGLGDETEVSRVVVTWPGGKTSVLESPAIGKDHVIAPNAAGPHEADSHDTCTPGEAAASSDT